jgi:phage terminase large subunit-like protein
VSAEAYSKEGLNPSRVIMDELHAHRDRTLFDVFSLAMGNRGKIGQLVAITTAGVKSDSTGRDSVCYSLYQYGKKVASGEIDDPAFFMAWWEAPEGLDFRSRETWEIANPGFDDLVAASDFESAVRRTPEPEFRTKRLNQWVSSAVSWLPGGAWDECASEVELNIPEGAEIVLGFDGSYSGDCTAIVGAVVQRDDEPIQVFLVKAWEKDLTQDGDDWRVDIAEVEATIVEACQKWRVREIVCDPFRWQRSMQALEDQGWPVVEFPQSPSRMIKACAKFFDAVVAGGIVHDGDPLLGRHLDNTMTKLTPAGPHVKKENPNSPRKIDAAVAAIMAVDRATVGTIAAVVPQFFV